VVMGSNLGMNKVLSFLFFAKNYSSVHMKPTCFKYNVQINVGVDLLYITFIKLLYLIYLSNIYRPVVYFSVV